MSLEIDFREFALPNDFILNVVIWIATQFAYRQYEAVLQRCETSRLTADQIQTVIALYGREIVVPPPNAYQSLDLVRVGDDASNIWSVRAPLFSSEEGRSDLTMELTVKLVSGLVEVEFDDLHVL